MTSLLLLRTLPLLRNGFLNHRHQVGIVAGGILSHRRRLLCSLADRPQFYENNDSVSPVEGSGAAAMNVTSPVVDNSWRYEDPDYRKWKNLEAEILRDIEPISLLAKEILMHCEACATEIKKRIMRMKGVESAESDLKSSQVTVKGVFEPQKLVEYVYKRTGKHAAIMKIDPPPPPPPEEAAAAAEGEKKEEEKGEGESKGEEGKDDKAKTDEEKKEGDGGKGEGEAADNGGGEEEGKVVEVRKIENPYYYYYYQPPRVAIPPMEMPPHAYPPQLFSDENPNACTVM